MVRTRMRTTRSLVGGVRAVMRPLIRALRVVADGAVYVMGIILRLLLEESLSSARSSQIIVEAAMRHDLPMQLAPGFGPPQLR